MFSRDTGRSDNAQALCFFAVRNALENRYCTPICFSGPAAGKYAQTVFNNGLASLSADAPVKATDLSLWYVGELDPVTGKIVCPDNPLFMS